MAEYERKPVPMQHPGGRVLGECQIVLIADNDRHPGDRQQGQRNRGNHDAPDTGFTHYGFNAHGCLPPLFSPVQRGWCLLK